MHHYGLFCGDKAVSLLVSGCRYENCRVEEAKDFSSGSPVTDSVVQSIIESLPKDDLSWFYVRGGDIFEPENVAQARVLLNRVKSARPLSKVAVWSGHTYEQLVTSDFYRSILRCIDVLVWVATGLSHQQMIDIPASLNSGVVINYASI